MYSYLASVMNDMSRIIGRNTFGVVLQYMLKKLKGEMDGSPRKYVDLSLHYTGNWLIIWLLFSLVYFICFNRYIIDIIYICNKSAYNINRLMHPLNECTGPLHMVILNERILFVRLISPFFRI